MSEMHITLPQLIALRRQLGFNQTTMAELMGLSKSAYVNIEIGFSPFRKIHALAAERVALSWAIQRDLPEAVPYPVYFDLDQAAKKWTPERLREAVMRASEQPDG